LQRLYSTFPSGRPGIGLLLLRVAAGGFLIGERVIMMTPLPASPLWEMNSVLLCVGACICVGVWTPIVGGIATAAEVAMMLSHPVHAQTHCLIAVLGLSLALLGPGAWSIDALLFGRKRIAL
jgi:putative oxidoreductase